MTTSLDKCQNRGFTAYINCRKNLHSVNTGLDGNSGVVHVASDMGENLHQLLDLF